MNRTDPEELLAVWAHRPEDLSADERRAVEALVARDERARTEADADRALLARVASLPAEGVEPSWAEMAAAIRGACPEPRPSAWARWRAWIAAGAGGTMLAAAAAIALFVSAGETLSPAVDHLARMPLPAESTMEPPPVLESLDDGTVAELLRVVEESSADGAVDVADDGIAADADVTGDSDLAWIDTLDDGSVDTLVQWLATEPG